MTVRLFARLKDLAGRQVLECDVPPGASVRDVWRAVVAGHASLGPFEGSVSCAVNEDFARVTTPVKEGDEVAFLPPVSGGAHPCR